MGIPFRNLSDNFAVLFRFRPRIYPHTAVHQGFRMSVSVKGVTVTADPALPPEGVSECRSP